MDIAIEQRIHVLNPWLRDPPVLADELARKIPQPWIARSVLFTRARAKGGALSLCARHVARDVARSRRDLVDGPDRAAA